MTDALALVAARRLSATGKAEAIRKAARLSIADVATAIGADTTTVFRWEKAQRRPHGERAARWAELMLRLERQDTPHVNGHKPEPLVSADKAWRWYQASFDG